MTDVLKLLGTDIVRKIGLQLPGRELYVLCSSKKEYSKVCTPSFLEKYFSKSYPESYKPKYMTWAELLEVWSNYLNPQFVYNGVNKSDIIQISTDRLLGYLEDEKYESIKDIEDDPDSIQNQEDIIIKYVFLIYSLDKSGNENSRQVIIIYQRPDSDEINAYTVDIESKEVKNLPLSDNIISKLDNKTDVQKKLSKKLDQVLLLFASDLKYKLASILDVYTEKYEEFEPFAEKIIKKIDLMKTKPSKKVYDRLVKDITILIYQSEEFIFNTYLKEELEEKKEVLKAKYGNK